MMDYPYEWIRDVRLVDGTELVVRPIRPDDAPRLQEGFSRLTPQTIYLRFLETFQQLSDKQAREFANLDYKERMALVATIHEDGHERLIGVARYALLGEAHPGVAECAVVVRDDYQNRGVGQILIRDLVEYARKHAVRQFIGSIKVGNARILHMITTSGLDYERVMLEPGVWEVRISLHPVP